MQDTPIYMTLFISGMPIRQDWALAELDNPEDISGNLTTIAQDYAETQGYEAEISVFYEPDETPGYRMIVVGPPSISEQDIAYTAEWVTEHTLSAFAAPADNIPDGSIYQSSYGPYFAESLQIEGKNVSNDEVLIASDSILGAQMAAETYITDTINAGDFYTDEGKDTMDGSYVIVDPHDDKVLDNTFSMAGDRLGFMFITDSQSSSIGNRDEASEGMAP